MINNIIKKKVIETFRITIRFDQFNKNISLFMVDSDIIFQFFNTRQAADGMFT